MKYFSKNKINILFEGFLYLIFPACFISFVDPTLLKYSKTSYLGTYPSIVCNDLPICFRAISLNLNNLSNFIFNKMLFFLNVKISSNFGYFFISFLSLSLTFLFISKIIKNNFITFFCLSYVLIILIFYEVPLMRFYDYLVLVYIFFILSNIEILCKNFFSLLNIFLLLIGNLIFEYAGFLFFGSIILFNFLTNFFEKKLFQFKHVILFLIPFLTLLLLFVYIKSIGNYYWNFEGIKDPKILYQEYGRFNHLYLIIIYLIKYSKLLIITIILFIFFYLRSIKLEINYSNYISRLLSKNYLKINICFILTFLLAVLVGKFISGYQSEWQRQFIPFLFLTTVLSGSILVFIKENFFDRKLKKIIRNI